LPANDACKVKERLWQAVGGYFCYSAKYYHEHEGGESGLYEEPCRSEYGLFVLGYDVALYKHTEEVTVIPYLAKVYFEEFVFWFYDGGVHGGRIIAQSYITESTEDTESTELYHREHKEHREHREHGEYF
jgi:hypothetical protein